MKEIYGLYFKKSTQELIIETCPNLLYDKDLDKEEVDKFNDCYFVGGSRKVLKTKAQEIKNKWIEETQMELNKLMNMKIKVKYK